MEPTAPSVMDWLECLSCGAMLLPSSFYGGRDSRCKACRKGWQAIRRDAHAQDLKEELRVREDKVWSLRLVQCNCYSMVAESLNVFLCGGEEVGESGAYLGIDPIQ